MNKIKILIVLLAVGIGYYSCQEEEYSLGDLTAPTNLVINTEIVGKDANNPYGDGSGNVIITPTADDVLAYRIDYGTAGTPSFSLMSGESVTKKYTATGVNTYTITVIAYGRGGTSTTMATDVTVRSDFSPEEYIVTDLTNNSSKTWIVDKSVPGHMGVGPWSSRTSDWWNAAINEKVSCCNCFYTTTFTFSQSGNNFTLQVQNPDGAFTKTGSLTNLPGIPSSGDEGCYSYAGGTNSFSFAPTDSENENTTNTLIKMGGNNIYIAYGACLDSYEILEITSTYMYLRVQGTETGNAWYFKLTPAE